MTEELEGDCSAPCCGCAEMRLSLPAGRPVCRLEIQYGERGCVRVVRGRWRDDPPGRAGRPPRRPEAR